MYFWTSGGGGVSYEQKFADNEQTASVYEDIGVIARTHQSTLKDALMKHNLALPITQYLIIYDTANEQIFRIVLDN